VVPYVARARTSNHQHPSKKYLTTTSVQHARYANRPPLFPCPSHHHVGWYGRIRHVCYRRPLPRLPHVFSPLSSLIKERKECFPNHLQYLRGWRRVHYTYVIYVSDHGGMSMGRVLAPPYVGKRLPPSRAERRGLSRERGVVPYVARAKCSVYANRPPLFVPAQLLITT